MKLLTSILCASAFAAAPIMAADFKSPSENILCYLEAPQEGALICLVFDAEWPISPQTEECGLDEIRAIVIPRDGMPSNENFCHGDVFWPYPNAILGYGPTWSVDGFSCAVETTGVTCTNAQGRGAIIRRATLDLF